MENEEWVTGRVRLSLRGQPIDLQMTVPARAVKPQRMLPIFQQLSSSFADAAEKSVETVGAKVSCRKGCGACCRQLIPLAEIEAYEIAEMVETFPEPRRSQIKIRFEKAWRHFAEIGWFERLDHCDELSKTERDKVVVSYFNENVACPFLEDESCSIHAARPMICREYMVVSPPENCSDLAAENVNTVELAVKPSEVLREITNSRKLGGAVSFVPLILALEWARKNADEFPEKTGEQWMADFFTNLTKSEIPKSTEK